jgi:hypothetical protein
MRDGRTDSGSSNGTIARIAADPVGAPHAYVRPMSAFPKRPSPLLLAQDSTV